MKSSAPHSNNNAVDIPPPTKFTRQEGRGNASLRVASAWFRDASEVPPFTDDYRPYTGKQLMLARRRNIEDQEKSWDKYYSNNTINGFKDRHYLLREFPELASALAEKKAKLDACSPANNNITDREAGKASVKCLDVADMVHWTEIGCGVGNAMMPVFEEFFPVLRLSGFDISPFAVQMFQTKVTDFLGTKGLPATPHTEFIPLNLSTQKELPPAFPAFISSPSTSGEGGDAMRGQADFASCVFVLSAIPPEEQAPFLEKASRVLKVGGWLYIRDYCQEDMAEKRFGTKVERSLVSTNTYMRTNGTLSHFFSEDSLTKLLEAAGYECPHCVVVTRSVENRKENIAMDRKWVQVRARKVR